jgi:hypothetical protein
MDIDETYNISQKSVQEFNAALQSSLLDNELMN